MRLHFCFSVTSLLASILLTSCSRFGVTNVVDIVIAVKQYFRSGCVYFLNDKQNDSHKHVMYKETASLLMRRQVPAAVLSPKSLLSVTDIHCQGNKPLYVFPYGEKVAKNPLVQISTEVHMSKATWLVFLDTERLDGFVSDIHIPFDCEFLVVQQAKDKGVILTEVYRVTPSFPLQKHPFGTWSAHEGLVCTNIGFYQRRDNLQGLALKTAFLKPSTEAEIYELKGPSGFMGDLWHLLEDKMNFTTEYHFPTDENTGGDRNANGTWSGVFGLFQRHVVAVTNVVFSMVSARMEILDYSVPTLNIKSYVIIKTPSTYDFRWNMFRSFSSGLWILIGCTAALLAVSLASVNVLTVRHGLQECADYSLSKSIVTVIGAYCQKADSVTPRTISMRLAFLTIYLSTGLLFTCYSAAFITDLTLQDPALPFTNFEELLDDGSYTLGMMRKSAQMDYFKESKIKLLKLIYKRLIAPHESTLTFSDVEGLRRICYGQKYAHVTSDYNLLKEGYLPNCSTSLIPKAFFRGVLAIPTAKKSPYLGLLNHKLQTMRRVGILDRIYHRFALKLRHDTDNTKLFVDLYDTAPHLIILATGTMLSLCVFITCECTTRFAHPQH